MSTKQLTAFMFQLMLLGATVASAAQFRPGNEPMPRSDLSLNPSIESPDAILSKWLMGGTAKITDDVLSLTADERSSVGWAFLRKPAWGMGEKWMVDLEFHVHGGGRLFGDGLALWYTKGQFASGPNFGASSDFDGALCELPLHVVPAKSLG